MTKRFLIVIIIAVLFVHGASSQILSTDDRLRNMVDQNGQAEVTIPYPGIKSIEFISTNVSILSVKDKVVHVMLSPLTTEWFIRQNFQYQISEIKTPKGITSAADIKQVMEWERYPTYSQYDSIMRSYSNLYPSLCTLDTIGTSINGRLVLVLKISGETKNKPSVFYTSTMHGDETGGFILMLRLADYLLKNYSTSSRVRTLVDELEIWINPLANPDGTYRTGNYITAPTRFNANGVDLNRNFPDPFTPDTEKQKETLDMMNFLSEHRFALSANFHSGAEVVNYPWDRWLSKFHADDSWFNSISRAYADTAHVYGGQAYMNFLDNGVTRGSEWYLVFGGRQDFVTGDLYGREVTIELDDQHVTPEAQLELLWHNNWRSLLGFLENALYGIQGKVVNVNSKVPLHSRVFINGHDKDSSHVYSDSLTGSFVRFLSPGSWNLTFSASGFKDTTINVIVIAGQKTDLTVEMSPVVTGIESPVSSVTVLLYPNPARNILKALLPDSVAGSVNIKIVNLSGMIVADFESQALAGVPLSFDISSLSGGPYTIIFKSGSVTCHGRFMVIK